MKLTDAQIRAAAAARITQAMEHIEAAQNQLASACSELSAITGGVPVWNACHKLTDQVHAFWYRVQDFRAGGRWSLDSTNIEALERRLAPSPADQP